LLRPFQIFAGNGRSKPRPYKLHFQSNNLDGSRKLRPMWKWFAFDSAFFAALTAISSKVGVQGVPSNLATAIRSVVILILAWGLVFARGENSALSGMPRATLGSLVLSGVATALSWLCYFCALQDGPAKEVAPLDKLSLPLTIVLAALFLKEKWTVDTSIGVAMVSAGTYFLTK